MRSDRVAIVQFSANHSTVESRTARPRANTPYPGAFPVLIGFTSASRGPATRCGVLVNQRMSCRPFGPAIRHPRQGAAPEPMCRQRIEAHPVSRESPFVSGLHTVVGNQSETSTLLAEK